MEMDNTAAKAAYLKSLYQTLLATLKGVYSDVKTMTMFLAAKLVFALKTDIGYAVPMRRIFRDLLSQNTMSTDEVDAMGWFEKQAYKQVTSGLIAKGMKTWSEDDAFKLKVEKVRIEMMKTHPSVQSFAIPVKLFGKTGTVWLLKSNRKSRLVTPFGQEKNDTWAWDEVTVSEHDWKHVGRKLVALSVALHFFGQEEGPDSVGIFDLSEQDDMDDFMEAFMELDKSEVEAGEEGEEIDSDVTKRLKLFDKTEVLAERLGALLNADGGHLARTKTAEERRLSGEVFYGDKIQQMADNSFFGEQAVQVLDMEGNVVENTTNWKFENPALESAVQRFFMEHLSFPQVCVPNTMGKTGFKAGKPFYAEGFGKCRLAVKGEDSFLLFMTPVNRDQAYQQVKESLKAMGIRTSKEEFKLLVAERLRQMNQGREVWFFKGIEGKTLALKFRNGSDTDRLIKRMVGFKFIMETTPVQTKNGWKWIMIERPMTPRLPLPQWQIDGIPAEQIEGFEVIAKQA